MSLILFYGCSQFDANKFMAGHSSAKMCDADSAYAVGFNAGKNNDDMATNPAASCDVLDQAMLVKKYQQGFRDGIKNVARPSTVVVAGQQQQGAGWECKEAYGKKKCGYDCIEAYGKIKCATQPNHNCVEAYAKIKCGLNCREDFGRIKCDYCLLYTSPSPRDRTRSRMPSSA